MKIARIIALALHRHRDLEQPRLRVSQQPLRSRSVVIAGSITPHSLLTRVRARNHQHPSQSFAAYKAQDVV
jgi:hypothetical protein